MRTQALALAAVACTTGPTLAGTANVDVTAAEVWALPDYDPYQSQVFDWVDGNGVGLWVDGLNNLGELSAFDPSIHTYDTPESYLGAGSDLLCDNDEILGTTDATCSHQLISGGAFDFDLMAGDVPTTFDNAIALNRTAPNGFAALNILGFSFSGTDAAHFDLAPSDFPETFDGESTAFSLDFTGTESRDYSAILNLETDTPGLTIDFNITGTVRSADPGTGIPTPTAFAAGALLLAGIGSRRRR